MYRRLSWLPVTVCLLGVNAGLAQDPTKVEPKHYRLAFENEHVQVVYVHYGPHEKSVMHDHPGGVVVNITDGHLRFTDQHGSVQEVTSKHGEARWFKPSKHRVENLARRHALRRGLHRGQGRHIHYCRCPNKQEPGAGRLGRVVMD